VMRRSLPSTVDVFVSEREPIGIGRIHSDMYLVDDRGVIIDQYGPQYADLDLPIIDGLSPAPGENGALTDEGRADLAARVIAAVKSKPVIAKRLSQVDVSDAHNASVILGGDPAMIQLGDDQFLARLQAYLDLAPALRERVADIDYVDLRFDDRIYVRPTKDGKKVRSKKEEVRSKKLERRTSHAERRTQNAERRTSNVEHLTSNVEHHRAARALR